MATKTKEKPGTAVTKPQATSGGAIVPVSEELLNTFAEHAGAGLGNAQATDFALPFIYLLQKQSPALDTIEGAEAGMFLNTVTQRVSETCRIIPVEYDKCFNEWVPRDAGGGFVATHRTMRDAEANKREDLPAGRGKPAVSTQIVETANHYVLEEQPDGSWMQCILSLTSTKLKASRQLLSRIMQVTAVVPGKGRIQMPSFSKIYELRPTGPHTNEKGTFYSVEIVPVEGEEGWVQDPAVVEQAVNFQHSLKAGLRGADFSKLDETVVQGTEEDDLDEEERQSGKRKY